MNQEVNDYLNRLEKWKDELKKLREIILDCGLTEDFKWMHPCYTHNGKNILLIHEFKNYCAILFNKGALLKDSENLLVQQTENTQSARQIRFTEISVIEEFEPVIKRYIKEAIEVEKSGLKTKKKKIFDLEFPEELVKKFEENQDFERAFKSLTEGRQRGYLLYFLNPKQSKTRMSRIEKYKERILEGFGMYDCTCGLSNRMPNCDGSHKHLKTL